MNNDILKQFDSYTAKPDPRKYNAYGTNQANKREFYIDVRDKNGDGRLVSYSYITQVKYTADRLVSLIGTDFGITLEGRNLKGLIQLLRSETIQYVQEFNSHRFDTPDDEEPIIEKMTFAD